MSAAPPAPTTAPLSTPTLRRRLACALYECVVLFGVGLLPALLSTLATQWVGPGFVAQALTQLIGFACFGAYFIWMWTRAGQTLPMQTWRIRVVAADGSPLNLARAAWRYTLSWLWIAPGVLIGVLAGRSKWDMLAAIALWAVVYALLAWLPPNRQFLHDRFAGTRLVVHEPAVKP